MPALSQQIRFCKSRDGTRIAYAMCGSGPPIVWIQHWVHHLEFDWASPIWRPWLDLLARHHTLIRFDWRGCGLSDRDRIDFSFDNYVADLEAVVDAADVNRFALFGMAGTGSGIAMSHAVRHAERVACLILHACHVKGRMAGSPSPHRLQEAQARLKVIELGWPNDTPAYGQFFTALHVPDASASQIRAYNDLLRKTTSPENAVRLLQTFWTADFSETIPKVRCPTVIFQARGDSVIRFDEGREVAARIPDARLVPLESRNHLLLDTEPAWSLFVQALQQFLAALLPAPAAVPLDDLTAREREVLSILAQGLDNHGIAARLKISEKTVRNQVSMIFSKLGVKNRAQAVALARDAGLGRRNFG